MEEGWEASCTELEEGREKGSNRLTIEQLASSFHEIPLFGLHNTTNKAKGIKKRNT
jgi:hypothetical protein